MSIAEMPAPTRVGPDSNGMAMTPEEFDALTERDESVQYELKRNLLIAIPLPGIVERKLNDELGYWLMTYHNTSRQGSHLVDTVYSQSIATPSARHFSDRVIWTESHDEPETSVELPTIAIDFVSGSVIRRRRDYIEKRDEYAAAGVREYWIIDRFRRTMTVFCGAETEHVLGEGETWTTELLPGFELPLSRLLEIADRVTGS